LGRKNFAWKFLKGIQSVLIRKWYFGNPKIWKKFNWKFKTLNDVFFLTNELNELAQLLRFKGLHGLFFIIIKNMLIFYGNLFGEGKYPILTVITNRLNDYEHELINKYPNGWGYILSPQKELFIGEFNIASLL